MQSWWAVCQAQVILTSTCGPGLRQTRLQLPTCAIAAPQRCEELVVAEEAHPFGTRLPRKDEDLRGTV